MKTNFLIVFFWLSIFGIVWLGQKSGKVENLAAQKDLPTQSEPRKQKTEAMASETAIEADEAAIEHRVVENKKPMDIQQRIRQRLGTSEISLTAEQINTWENMDFKEKSKALQNYADSLPEEDFEEWKD